MRQQTQHTVEHPDVAALLRLEPIGDACFRSIRNERNLNGRVFGGQLLGQTLAAALATVPPGRQPSSLQLCFLQGPDAEAPIDYRVTRLQDGGRISSRSVSASQAGVGVAQGTASFAVPSLRPDRQQEHPDSLSPDDAIDPQAIDESLHRSLIDKGFTGLLPHPFIDFRFPDSNAIVNRTRLDEPLRFWVRIREPLANDAGLQALAFAYLSDWWLPFASFGLLIAPVDSPPHYIASLNQSMWFYPPLRADEWILVVSRSLRITGFRNLTSADFYDRQGRLIAHAVQEAVASPRRS